MENPTPRTIEELRAWYAAHNLPPEQITRFFIGKNIMEPKAFGIYRDGDVFVVYKNKADGSRAVRYQGPDEGYAVNELYMRLKDEIANQKAGSAFKKEAQHKADRTTRIVTFIVVVVLVAVIGWFVVWNVMSTPGTGYYYYDDNWYYYSDGWYEYGNDGWRESTAANGLNDHYDDYYVSYAIDDSYGIPNIELTEYYSDKDTDSSWDSGDSWDSGSTDWGSDW